MNISKIFSVAAVIISLTATTAFGATDIMTSNGTRQNSVVTESKPHVKKECKQKHEEFSKDPLRALESRKVKIQSLLKEGKITKENADERIARIDSKIKEIQSFNKLTLPQKKDKLIYDCKASVEKLVKEGKLDRVKADTLLKNYSEKINKWDGNGYPHFHTKCSKGECKKPATWSP